MQMKQCPNGHFYNADLSTECPYCPGASANANRTVPLGAEDGYSPTQPVGAGGFDTIPDSPQTWAEEEYSPTMPPSVDNGREDDEHTQAIIRAKTGLDPVVGWLVCCEGVEKGKDYRLHDGNNFIGRSASMDVCIQGDEQISRENSAWVAYDSFNKIFLFGGGTGRNLVYLNDKPMVGGQSSEIKAYDKIRIGGTTLLFIPMCGKDFDWVE